jgi:hypothetical protein
LVAAVRPEPRAEVPGASRSRSERLARQLALAHWIERVVEEGRAGSYGEVARALGLTESRITQITALLELPPAVQERVLVRGVEIGIREALRVAREVEWAASSGERTPEVRPAPALAEHLGAQP